MQSPFRLSLLMFFALALPGYAYRTSAWVPSWDGSAVTTMERHAGSLTETNPGWYSAAADGSITKNWGAEDPRMRAALSGTQLLPTIKNYVNGRFDGPMIATLVSSPDLREKHAEAIAQLVVTNAFDGIDIDYESVPSTARANLTAFIQLLASKLHASGKQLSVTVHAKTSDGGAQDWNAIGGAADSVKIMAYDYHWSTSAAGPITPLDWLDSVVAYARRTIPPQKVIVGLPWYGYDWLAQRADSVTFAEATVRAQNAGATIGRDANGEATFTYASRTVYFQDATSYRRKVDAILARHGDIGGFAHWRVGAEDPAIWDVVAQLHTGGGSSPIGPPARDFTIDGPAEIAATAGTSATARFRAVPINGFNAPVSLTARTLDPLTLRVEGTSLEIAVPATMTAGVYRVIVTMSGGGVQHEQVLLVQVTARKTPKRRSAR